MLLIRSLIQCLPARTAAKSHYSEPVGRNLLAKSFRSLLELDRRATFACVNTFMYLKLLSIDNFRWVKNKSSPGSTNGSFVEFLLKKVYSRQRGPNTSHNLADKLMGDRASVTKFWKSGLIRPKGNFP